MTKSGLVGLATSGCAILALAGCGSTGPSIAITTPAPPGVSPTASPTAATLSGPAGTAFTDTDAQANSMKVTLTQVLDPAPAGPYDSVTNGDRLVAAKFSIVGVSGTFSSDANLDASLIGSDGQTYTSFAEPIGGCTNFNYGTYSVTAGATTVGCVGFEVPLTVKTARIEWGGFLSGAPASWSVG